MRKMVFKELILLSLKDKAAKKVTFHPQINIVYGMNDTGKSSLIKSLYNSLGADVEFDNEWKQSQVISLLSFSLNNKDYKILRSVNGFSLFENNKFLGHYQKITSQLSPVMSELLNYKFTLADKQQNQVVPTPAYFFLPFYIDQDSGWHKAWNSFKNLAQFSRWEQTVIYYHLGIFNNEYFELMNLIAEESSKLKVCKSNISSLRYALEKYEKEIPTSAFSIDIKSLQKEIELLMTKLTELNIIEGELKAQLLDLYEENLLYTTQKQAITNKIKGLSHHLSKLDGKCKHCGSIHNNFEEKLDIAEDEAQCYQMLEEVESSLLEINSQIEKTNKLYKQKAEDISSLREILSKKQGDLKLQDVLKIEGMKSFAEKLRNDIAYGVEQSFNIETHLNKLKKQKQKINSKKRKTEILTNFENKMDYFFKKLSLHKKSQDIKGYIQSYPPRVKAQGSTKPRILLAYYYSILSIAYENSTSTFCPIVIDSPKQQDVDEKNLTKMLEVIFNDRPDNTQVILGVVDKPNVISDCQYIYLENENQLLSKTDFEEVFNEVKPLLLTENSSVI